jgi:hypothetical protein
VLESKPEGFALMFELTKFIENHVCSKKYGNSALSLWLFNFQRAPATKASAGVRRRFSGEQKKF